MSKFNIITRQMDGDTDKGRYWQYKLKQKEKAKKVNQPKNNKNKVKTPEKVKKHSSILTQDNFFSNTIQKLKGLLQNTQQQKSKILQTNSTKHSKEVITSRSQPYDVFKKCKQNQKQKRNQSNSMIQLKREKKELHQLVYRNELMHRYEKQSPNKSRSRSKSLKYKIDKQKKEKNKINEDKSLQLAKITKKKNSVKSKQTKSTTRKIQTIILPNLDEESNSWKKKLMETMVIHREKYDQQPEEQLKYVSNFRVWEEQEEKKFNQKKKRTEILCKYIKAFAVFASFSKRKEAASLRSSRNSRSSSSNLKDIFKSQEQKLLELKECLFNLKNSTNIDETLELLISKVNENIYSLKNFQSEQKMPQHSKKLSQSKLQEFNSRNKSKEGKGDIFETSFKKQKVEKKQILQERQSLSAKDNLLGPNIQNVHDQISLNYSNFQRSPPPNGYLSARESDPSFSLKEESSSLLLDSKFLKIQILTTPAQKDSLILAQNQSQPHSGNHQSLHNSSKQNISEEDMLLSASNEKNQEKIVLQHQGQPSVPNISKFSVKKELPIIKIEQDEQQQDQPIFQRSQPLSNQITDISGLKLVQIQQLDHQTNNTLINSLNKILEQKNIENDFSGFIQSGISIDQRNHIFEYVTDNLFLQTTQLLFSIAGLKDKLISQYNNDIVEVTQHHNDRIELSSNQDKETIMPITASDQYVLGLAEKVIREAYLHNLPERISKALGVPSLVTLRCIRKLNEGELQEEQTIEFNHQDEEMIQQYTEVIDSELYHGFEESFSPAPDNPYQMVFNRCVYDTLNLLLDDYRPFGSKGMPGICLKSPLYTPPKVESLVLSLKGELRQLTQIKMGLLDQRQLSRLQVEAIVSKTLRLWKEDVIRYIQKQYNYKQEDDTIERYELMLDVEQQIFSQEVMQLHLFMLNRQAHRFA